MSVRLNDLFPDFAFFTENETLHVFSHLKKSNELPLDEQWIHWPDFYHLPFEFLTYENHYIFPRSDVFIEQSLSNLGFDFKPLSKINFEKTFQHLASLFQEKSLQKAVPVVWSESIHVPSKEEISYLIHALLRLPPQFHCYGVLTASGGILGASPEFLFKINSDRGSERMLSCVAVAGTRLSLNLNEQDFLNSPKDRQEHQFVIDDIQHKLKKIGPVAKSTTRVQKFGSISHLMTDFSVSLGLAPMSLQQTYMLIKSLHPTSALGMYSKSLFWKEAENFPGQEGRPEKFGAPITFSSKHLVKSIVAIRNLIWNKHKNYLCVGCGVIEESQLDKEWSELYNKRQAVMQLFGIHS
jgi:isochorismate synthase EntC